MTAPSPPSALAAPSGALRPPAERLDPRARRLWTIEIALGAGALVVAGAIALAILTALDRVPWPVLSWGGLALAAAIGAAAALALPDLRYRHFRWEVTPLGLYVQRGWLWRTWTVVPHSRIQSIETTIGPLHRLFGLAQVEVRTASGEGGAVVPGLSEELVARLTAQLAAAAGTGDAA